MSRHVGSRPSVMPHHGAGEHHVSVRQIANGYITRQSSYDAESGEHSEHEHFTEKKPRIEMPRIKIPATRGLNKGALGRATRHLKK